MIRRALLAAVCVISLLLIFVASHRGDQQSLPRARALLIQAESRQGQIPHTGLLSSIAFIGRHPVSSLVRVVCAGPAYNRVEYLSSPLRGLVLFDDGERSWRYDSPRGVLYAEGPSREPASERLKHFTLLLRNYAPHFVGHERVAQRPALRLALINNHVGRMARELWIDEDTALVLRSEEYHPNGSLLMRTAYREVHFGVTARDSFALPPAAKARVVAAEVLPMPEPALARVLGTAVLHPQYVPAGFEFAGSYQGRCGDSCCKAVAHLRYTDGLRAISMFECPHPLPDTLGCDSIPLSHGNMVRIRHGNATFVFIGDADIHELQRMAESLP